MEGNAYNNEDWVLRPESAATEITGEELNLGNDILIFFKMTAYEQGVIDRIKRTPDYTLADEIKTDSGYIMLGNPEKIRSQMHTWVDALIATIMETRKQGVKNGQKYKIKRIRIKWKR